MKTCMVCGGVLPAMTQDTVCGDDACRQFKIMYTLRPPTTEVERRLYAFQVEKARINIARKKTELTEKEKALQEQLHRREQENREYHRQLIDDQPEMAAYPWIMLPSGQQKVTNLPARRRRLFRDFLNKVISRLCSKGRHVVRSETHSVNHSKLVNLQRQCCAVCQGGCCTNGANNAYLSSDSLLRFWRLNPQYRPRHLLDAYLEHLPEKSFAGSCIYHTQSGCNLPRQMRSEICNNYLCPPLKSFSDKVEKHRGYEKVLLLVRRQDLWRQMQIELDNSLIGAYVVENEKIKRLCSNAVGNDAVKKHSMC